MNIQETGMKIEIMLTQEEIATAMKAFILKEKGLRIIGGDFAVQYNNKILEYEAILRNVVFGENLDSEPKNNQNKVSEGYKMKHADNAPLEFGGKALNLDVS